MDYKKLLQKYIGEVINCESVDFFPTYPDDNWSQEEIDELNKLAKIYLKEQ